VVVLGGTGANDLGHSTFRLGTMSLFGTHRPFLSISFLQDHNLGDLVKYNSFPLPYHSQMIYLQFVTATGGT